MIRAATKGKSDMPSTVNLYQIGVWFCVGFFTGAGWAIAALLVGPDLLCRLNASVRAFAGFRRALIAINW